MIPYSRPKLSDLYTLSQSKLLENHILHSGTYMPVPSPPPHPPLPGRKPATKYTLINHSAGKTKNDRELIASPQIIYSLTNFKPNFRIFLVNCKYPRFHHLSSSSDAL